MRSSKNEAAVFARISCLKLAHCIGGQRLAMSTVLLFVGLSLTACSPRTPTRLEDPAIRAFVDAGLKATGRRDAGALCAQLADNAEVSLVEIRFSGSNVQQFNKPQWCEHLHKSYAALPRGVAVNTMLNVESMTIAADGQSAELRAEVVEEMAIAGQSLRMSSQQTAVLGLVAALGAGDRRRVHAFTARR
jgi:hypothetical protein